MVPIDANEALGSIDAWTTERSIATAAAVVCLVTGSALASNALAYPGLHAVRV